MLPATGTASPTSPAANVTASINSNATAAVNFTAPLNDNSASAYLEHFYRNLQQRAQCNTTPNTALPSPMSVPPPLLQPYGDDHGSSAAFAIRRALSNVSSNNGSCPLPQLSRMASLSSLAGSTDNLSSSLLAPPTPMPTTASPSFNAQAYNAFAAAAAAAAIAAQRKRTLSASPFGSIASCDAASGLLDFSSLMTPAAVNGGFLTPSPLPPIINPNSNSAAAAVALAASSALFSSASSLSSRCSSSNSLHSPASAAAAAAAALSYPHAAAAAMLASMFSVATAENVQHLQHAQLIARKQLEMASSTMRHNLMPVPVTGFEQTYSSSSASSGTPETNHQQASFASMVLTAGANFPTFSQQQQHQAMMFSNHHCNNLIDHTQYCKAPTPQATVSHAPPLITVGVPSSSLSQKAATVPPSENQHSAWRKASKLKNQRQPVALPAIVKEPPVEERPAPIYTHIDSNSGGGADRDEDDDDDESGSVVYETMCRWLDCSRGDCGTLDALVEHISSEHIQAMSHKHFVCLWHECCRERKPFKAYYMLQTHIRRHTGEKPHRCSVS